LLCLRTLSWLLRLEGLIRDYSGATVEAVLARLTTPVVIVVIAMQSLTLGVANLVDHGRGVLRVMEGLDAWRHHFHMQIVADLVPSREVVLVMLHHLARMLNRA